MTAENNTPTRADLVRERRAKKNAKKQTKTKKTSRASVMVRNLHPDIMVKPVNRRKATRPKKRQYHAISSASGTRVSVPTISLADMGWRWFSLGLLIGLVLALYGLWNSPTFIIPQAEVVGNQRISMEDINAIVGLSGQSIFIAEPELIEYTLRNSFPDLDSISVSVNLPNLVTIEVTERQPIIAWQNSGELRWIDAQGYDFPARGQIEGLIPVIATGNPPQVQSEVTAEELSGKLPFLPTEMVQALRTLAPYVPQGTSIFYDQQYGFGWNDTRGWLVYFGKEIGDLSLKLAVYQGLSNYLVQNGIPAKLISVEFPHKPFYRTD